MRTSWKLQRPTLLKTLLNSSTWSILVTSPDHIPVPCRTNGWEMPEWLRCVEEAWKTVRNRQNTTQEIDAEKKGVLWLAWGTLLTQACPEFSTTNKWENWMMKMIIMWMSQMCTEKKILETSCNEKNKTQAEIYRQQWEESGLRESFYMTLWEK